MLASSRYHATISTPAVFNLTEDELQRIQSFDSLQFGSTILPQGNDKMNDRKLMFKGIQYYTCKLKNAQALLKRSKDIDAIDESTAGHEEKSDAVTAEMCQCLLRLGHLHLLTEDFVKALSAYQNYVKQTQESVKDSTGLYGLGVVYFHFKQYELTIQVFRDLLYSYPNFPLNRDVNARLGMCYKMIDKWELALKHLNAAYVSSDTCSFSKLEIRFYTACCYDDQNNFKLAKEEYEAILGDPNCTLQLKASVLRQIGWLHFRSDGPPNEKNAKLNYAIEYLQESMKLDQSCGQTYYFLGRCLSAAGRAQEAFFAYRHSIDKSESNADTWCSIGVLYQKQQQPMDALQAYICAVQLDEYHTEAWVDLGLLYEKYGQPFDALQCYKNALKRDKQDKPDLVERSRILEIELKTAPPIPPSFKKTLPSLEEAWHLPIPAELTNRQEALQKQKIALYVRGPQPAPQNEAEDLLAQQKTCFLSPQQIQLMQILLQNQAQLNSSQLQLLRQLQEAYAISQQHSQKMSIHRSQQQLSLPPSAGAVDNVRFVNVADAVQRHASDVGVAVGSGVAVVGVGGAGGGDLPQVTQEDLQAFLGADDDGATSVAASYVGGGGGVAGSDKSAGGSGESSRDLANRHDPILSTAFLATGDHSNSLQDQEMNCSNFSRSQTSSIGQPPHESDGVGKSIKTPAPCNLLARIKIPVADLTAEKIVQAAKNRSLPNSGQILDELAPPPKLPAPLPQLPKEQLLLPTPTVMVYTKKEANSAELQQFCYKSPVVVMRGLCLALRLDLGLFSTRTLMQLAPEHQFEVRAQMYQPPDQCLDQQGRKTWHCESTRSFTTVAKYAQYQAQSFQLALKEEQEKLKPASRTHSSTPFASDSTSTTNISPDHDSKLKMIKFGTNLDLSDEKKWKSQLEELVKLPPFCRVLASSNMLSHLGHTVFGMNTVQLYMKVPGCRTPGHQENNNFSSLNINIGPGECEWFSVPSEYWSLIRDLCEENKVDYFRGSWWPPIEDLWANNIPVYRFTQKAGDVVWVGPGTVHWVQSTGWCNNIAWNIGSMTATQYHMALERYEWNKLASYKSIVPMMHLSWQLARNVKFSDQAFHEKIKSTLARSLYFCTSVLDYVTEKLRKEIKHHPRVSGETTHYCAVCEQEVFNVLFVLGHERKFYVHCLHCALSIDVELKTFVVLYQYLLDDLVSTFDNFQLTPKKAGLIC